MMLQTRFVPIQQAVVRRLEKLMDLKWSFGNKEEDPSSYTLDP